MRATIAAAGRKRYNRAWKDIIGLQSEIAQKVADALDARLTGREKATLRALPTENHDAYDAYMRGRYFLNKRTAESIEKARVLFGRRSPRIARFAPAHAGLADSYIQLGKIGAMSGDDAARLAWPEATTALALDDQFPRDIFRAESCSTISSGTGRPRRRITARRFDSSAQTPPPRTTGMRGFSAQTGHSAEALREIEIAQQQDPLSPMILVTKGKLMLMARRFDEAIAPARRALELEPDFAAAFSVLGQIYTHLGRRDAASGSGDDNSSISPAAADGQSSNSPMRML